VGGGALELEMARKLREFSARIEGKEQLEIKAFADAIETVPKILIRSAGLDPIDVLMKLRSEHVKGNVNIGIKVPKGCIDNIKEGGILDTYRAKWQAIKLATEVVNTILRIDDIIAVTRPGELKKREKEKMRESVFKSKKLESC